ncbi:MAG: drug/metabolite transporter (DMT)-like permease [Candidatus Endobugula sp.]|jgi:drug/metabolite transporter (DMT)-like permease
MNSRFAVLVLCLSSIGWGLAWLPIKGLNNMGLDTPHIIIIAFTSAALALLPWTMKQRRAWLPALPMMLALGFLGGFANVAFQTAISEGDVIRVMILFYMLPIWSVLGGKIFLNEAIDKRRIAALFICVGGAFFILEAWNFSWTSFSGIDLLALGAGVGLASTNILFRFTASVPLASKIGFMFTGCVMLMLIPLLLFPHFIAANTDWLLTVPLPDNGAVPLAMAYGMIWIMLISFGSLWAVTQIEAGRSAVILVLELVAAVTSVVLITHSDLKSHELIGGIMVLIAALLEETRPEPKEKTHQPSKL